MTIMITKDGIYYFTPILLKSTTPTMLILIISILPSGFFFYIALQLNKILVQTFLNNFPRPPSNLRKP